MNNKVPCGGFAFSNGLLKTADGDVYPNGGESVDVYMQFQSDGRSYRDKSTTFYIGNIYIVKK